MAVPREDIPSLLLEDLLLFHEEPYVMLSAFIDESGTHGGPTTCVAATMFKSEDARRFNTVWKKELAKAKIGMFHAVNQAHLRGELKDKTRKETSALYRRLIELIGKYMLAGLVVYSLPKKIFDAVTKGQWQFGQYATCTYLCIQRLRVMAKRLGFQNVTCNIEMGSDGMLEVRDMLRGWNSLLRRGDLTPESVRHARKLVGGPFVFQFQDKHTSRLLQTADVLAYEANKFDTERLGKTGRKMRKSMIALTSKRNVGIVYLDERNIRLMMAAWASCRKCE